MRYGHPVGKWESSLHEPRICMTLLETGLLLQIGFVVVANWMDFNKGVLCVMSQCGLAIYIINL
jgi:hypothetical protein